MSDANADEPSKPAAFNLPDGARSETHAYPERPLHILLATSGSVASVKAPRIASALLDVRAGAFILDPSIRSCRLTLYRMGLASQHANVEIQLVCTDASRHFYTASGVEEAARAKGKSVKVWTDADEWSVRDGCSSLLTKTLTLPCAPHRAGSASATLSCTSRCVSGSTQGAEMPFR